MRWYHSLFLITMNSQFSSPTTLLVFLFCILIGLIDLPPCDASALYENCSTSFNCGNITVTYPFWGDNRDRACGYDQLKLTCENGLAKINIASVKYRLLNYNPETQVMRIARDDYATSGLCSSNYKSTTLDPVLFQLVSSYVNITLLYGCPANGLPSFPGHFTCAVSGTSNTDGYVTAEAIYSIPTTCSASVVAPVQGSNLNLSDISSSVEIKLQQGFEVWLKVNATSCNECTQSKGVCGYNHSVNQATCYCVDGTSGSKTCSSSTTADAPQGPPTNKADAPQGQPTNGGKDKVSLGIGLAIAGAAITGILLGFWIFSCRQKKMRKRAAASEAQAQSAVSKDITPPSSKEGLLPTSTSNYSRSTPSFMSTQTDIEKGSTYFGVQVFTYVELEEATQHFDPSRELGDGGFGTVYYGELQDGRVVAVKRLYENNFKRMEQFMNEVEILTRLRHKNLVMLFGCTSRRSRELLLVYEYIPNGTVADHVHGKKASSSLLPWNVRLNIAIETADALTYLHQSDVIHRDVKTNNILLDNNFRVKVADFGLSRLFPNDVTHVSTAPQGTPGYVDPEYYQCYQLTDKSDVYSFGVVLCELISSKPAVDTNRLRHDINLANMAINKIQNHAVNELVDPSLGFDKDIVVRRTTTLVAELAFRCLQQEREMRPTMEEVLKCLLQIKKEEISTEKAEVVDIHADDVGQIKSTPPPFSPDSVVIDKWISNSTPNSY